MKEKDGKQPSPSDNATYMPTLFTQPRAAPRSGAVWPNGETAAESLLALNL